MGQKNKIKIKIKINKRKNGRNQCTNSMFSLKVVILRSRKLA
jgi:hypothetical protein